MATSKHHHILEYSDSCLIFCTVTISGSDIMPWLLEEFPYIHISPQTLHHMWNKSAHQIEQLSQVERGVKCKKSKAEVQVNINAIVFCTK